MNVFGASRAISKGTIHATYGGHWTFSREFRDYKVEVGISGKDAHITQ